MIKPIPANALPATWPQRLTSAMKTAWETTFRRSAQPVTAPPIATSKPVLLNVRTIPLPQQTAVVCLALAGELNRHTYTSLIEVASSHYYLGWRYLLLDLSQTTRIELSGLFALLSIARLYSGQTLLDPEAGWAGLRQATEEITPKLGERVKLIAPAPDVAAALAGASFCRFLSHYADWETALAAFSLA